MIWPNNEEAPSFSCHPRELSYYDNTNPSHHNPANITMGADRPIPTGNGLHSKMAIANKKHSHPHRHNGNRQRSKSWDRVHRKKYQPRRILDAHSPIHHHHHHHHHHHGRVSPKCSSSSELRGHLWIRPVARRQTMPSRPVSVGVAPQVEARGINNYDFAPISPKNDPSVRVAQSPTLDDEMSLFTSPSSSFNSFQRCGITSCAKKTRICFGQSGKPIKPTRKLSWRTILL